MPTPLHFERLKSISQSLVKNSKLQMRSRYHTIRTKRATLKQTSLPFQISSLFAQNLLQESLANAKVSARQPWYIGRNSLNRPHPT